MKLILYLYTFLSFSLYAQTLEERSVTIRAAHADYKNRSIVLSGDVYLEHDLGRMSAQKMEIISTGEDRKPRLGNFKLNDAVNIILNDSGQITCESAEFDCTGMYGAFIGHVVYTEQCKGRQQETIPLIVKSDEMTFSIIDEVKNEGSFQNNIQRIQATNNVTVSYNHDFIATANKGIYERRGMDEENHQPYGHIILEMNSQNNFCKILNRNGDFVEASTINIDTLSKSFIFENSHGVIIGAGFGDKQNQCMEFSANKLHWNHSLGELTLQDHVVVNQQGVGQLTASDDVVVQQQIIDGVKRLKAMKTTGKAVIVCKEPEKSIEHVITSNGSIYVDHVKCITTLTSPCNSKGKVVENLQVHFKDLIGEIFADKVQLYYSTLENKISISKIILEGNVRLKDKQDADGHVLHYALSDSVEYIPDSKEMLFKANARKRVLFFDQVNNLQVSAPALKIKRDLSTNHESIQGFGDVRFSFLEKEYTQLRSKFKFESSEIP